MYVCCDGMYVCVNVCVYVCVFARFCVVCIVHVNIFMNICVFALLCVRLFLFLSLSLPCVSMCPAFLISSILSRVEECDWVFSLLLKPVVGWERDS